MHQLKKIAKNLVPISVRRPIFNAYHLIEAVIANVRYGFPARSAQVIMVTGTNGKTTTVALIAKMLQSAGHTVGVISTAFYAFGDDKIEMNTSNRTVDDIFKVQALLARMKQSGCDYIVVEVTSQALDQYRVWGIPCDAAVMTNLTQDHLDYHGTMEKYAAAKGKLFARRPKLIVLNRDDQWFEFFNRYPAGERKVSYGTSSEATCQIKNVSLHKEGSDITLLFDGEHKITIHTQLAGKYNAYNATAAATLGYYLMLDPHQIEQGIAALALVPGRLERVSIKPHQPFEVIVDYAHTPDALKNLLDTLRHLTKGKLWIVFGATGDRDKSKRPIMGEIAGAIADKIVLTDEEPYNEDPEAIRAAIRGGIEKAGWSNKLQEIPDRQKAIEAAIKGAGKEDCVVITGMGHEQFRVVAGVRQPWSDTAVAHQALEKLVK